VCVCWLIAREWIHRFAPNLACLFLETRNRFKKRSKVRKNALSSKPGEGGFCILETKASPRQKLFVLTTRLQKKRSQPRKSVLSSSLGEDGFRDNIFSMIFNDTYRMIRPMASFRAVKIDTKCKHLSNFPAVTLRTCC
jgi:hypothetical protein